MISTLYKFRSAHETKFLGCRPGKLIRRRSCHRKKPGETSQMKWKRLKRYFFLGIIVSISLLAVPIASADRGMIPVDPNVSVHEPGQKAIVAWNGVEEGLILSTNVSSDRETEVVEMLPLPSKPEKVEEASFESFERLQGLIMRHGFQLAEGREMGGKAGGQAPEVVLHKEIGLHDITVARASDRAGLLEWIGNFLNEHGVEKKISLGNFKPVIEDYLRRGFNYWVIDLIEVSGEKTVEPIYYEFESNFAYYPLEITRPVGGSGKVSLFLLTDDDVSGNVFPLERARYELEDGTSEPIDRGIGWRKN
ncbi:hypothetical protein AKJ61_02355 [candidate division MSBL1 archaeon SCGC-AAA259B11]|uniref:DUF2330 domain-containing protein n=1 Tax=candidate division MSBL1 archaeon SCGC-AAA259B11 TaxID=1698260 RepID=A0A133U679_9EURY|nr:hypothetical protein AKJ61_02355 [candidate division MSBL1 archaeon SCGC-AAA259B11]